MTRVGTSDVAKSEARGDEEAKQGGSVANLQWMQGEDLKGEPELGGCSAGRLARRLSCSSPEACCS